MSVFILWAQTVLENKYVTFSGEEIKTHILKEMDMIHYLVWFDLFVS
jgi:hypothetical protein